MGTTSTLSNRDMRTWTNYLHQRPEILGWFYEPDPLLFATMLHQQVKSGVKGDVLEIGSYAGKSAVLLGFGLRPDETLHVCDPFVFPQLSNDPQRGTTRFLANYRRFHAADPDVFVGPSRDFPRVGKSYRFIHIDGSHLFNDVVGDIQIARDLCVAGSVIVMDDYSSAGWPGVAAAIWAAVERGELTAFCMSTHKLYASVDPQAARALREAIVAALANAPGVAIEREDIAGSEAILTAHPPSVGLRGVAREVMPPVARRLLARAAGRPQPEGWWRRSRY